MFCFQLLIPFSIRIISDFPLLFFKHGIPCERTARLFLFDTGKWSCQPKTKRSFWPPKYTGLFFLITVVVCGYPFEICIVFWSRCIISCRVVLILSQRRLKCLTQEQFQHLLFITPYDESEGESFSSDDHEYAHETKLKKQHLH